MEKTDKTTEEIDITSSNNKKIKLYKISKVFNILSLICLALDLLYICFRQKEELDFIIGLIKEEADSFYFAKTIINIPVIIAIGLILIFAFTSAINIVLRKKLTIKYTINTAH